MQVSPYIIQETAEDKRIGALAIGLMVKTAFANSVIYNFSPHRHAKLFGISVSLLQKNVSWLINNGYAHITGGNLRMKKLFKLNKVAVPFPKKEIRKSDYYEVIAIIRYGILKFNSKQQEYRIEERRKTRHKFTYVPASERRKARDANYKPEDEREGENGWSDEIRFTLSTVGNIIGASRNTTVKWINIAIARGWMSKKKNDKKIGHMSQESFSHLARSIPEAVFFRMKESGLVIQSEPNSYSMLV